MIEEPVGDDLPTGIELISPESIEYFKLLEAFSDSFGGWRIFDLFGKPVIELPEKLVTDLLILRRLVGQMRRQREKEQKTRTVSARWRDANY